jgi:polyhydroxyalkanoate synthase
MHSEYLRRLFLDNDLAEGRYVVDGGAVSLNDLRVPTFAVATETDHIAPWRSAYKLHLLTDTEVTFVLTTGGHNAGVISEPGHGKRNYRIATRAAEGRYVDADAWLASARRQEGSWWPEWAQWLGTHSGQAAAPPRMGTADGPYRAVAEAPGSYVHTP